MASLGHPDRFQSEEALNLVRGLLGWSAPGLAGARRKDSRRRGSPRQPCRQGVRAIRLLHLLRVSAADLAFLPAAVGGVQVPTLAPYAPLHPLSGHLRPPLRDVRRGGPLYFLFHHFFVLVKSGKARDHLGAYYFQTRPDSAVAYISTFGGVRWENWRGDWVIASAEAIDRLVQPSNGPALDRKHWRTKPSLSLELLPMLDRIKTLATGGLTSMHVVSDFLKRRVMPL
jgi:hypothetical protein